MPQPRTPLAKAKVTGADIKHPERFSKRREPKSKPLGDPSPHLDETQTKCWEAFKQECPWLLEADRTLMETASNLRARLWNEPGIGVNAIAQLRMCLGAMGGTPADRSKVTVPDGEEEDPSEKYFN